MASRIVFISGHLNLQPCEFETNYQPHLNVLLSSPASSAVVVGSSPGADAISLNYLLSNGFPAGQITIYYFNPRGRPEQVEKYRKRGLNVVDGFTSHSDRDAAMTRDSTEDLLWVRPEEETRALIEAAGEVYRPGRVSGTEHNRRRRRQLLQAGERSSTGGFKRCNEKQRVKR